jgi:replicative DNA helicase
MLQGEGEKIAGIVYPQEIYHDDIKKLYEAIVDHFFEHGAIARSICYDRAENLKLFSMVDLKLYEAQATEEDTEALISELKEYVLKRQIKDLVIKVDKELTNPVTKVRELVKTLSFGMNSIQNDLDIKYYNMIDIKEQMEDEKLSQRLPIGVDELDRFYHSVGSHTHQTEVHVAESKHGKTTYACYRIAKYANQGLGCLYFTLEGSRFDLYEMLRNQVAPEYMKNVIIVDKALKASDIVAKINEVCMTHDIKMVCIDYIQRIFPEEGRYTTENERIANASIQITSTALKYGLYALILAQPRKIDQIRKEWNRFPNVDDVYGTGQVIKDAYCVTAGFRPALVQGLTYVNEFIGREGVRLPGEYGKIVSKNSYFLKMLICRKGEIYKKVLQFVQQDEILTQNNEDGYPANDFIKL